MISKLHVGNDFTSSVKLQNYCCNQGKGRLEMTTIARKKLRQED